MEQLQAMHQNNTTKKNCIFLHSLWLFSCCECLQVQEDVCAEVLCLKRLSNSWTSRFLKPQVLMQRLPCAPWFSEGGLTVMDSYKLGTNKSLGVVDSGPRGSRSRSLQETHSKLNPLRLPGLRDAFPVPHAHTRPLPPASLTFVPRAQVFPP